MKEEKYLIDLLQELIEDYHSEIEKNSPSLPDLYEEQEIPLNHLLDDIQNIIKVDIDSIEKLLEEVIEDRKEREELFDNIKIIQTLLRLNSEKQTTYRLSMEQLSYITTFLKKVKLLMKKKEDERIEKREKKIKLETICEKYEKLLNCMTNPNNSTIISDVELIELLLKESNLDSNERRKVLISLMKKNQKTYENILTNKITKIRLSDKELEKIFEKYGYDYNQFTESNKEYLKEYTTYEDIIEKLKIWVNCNLPIIDILKEGDIFTHLLIRIKSSSLEKMIKGIENTTLDTIDLYEIIILLLIDSKNDTILNQRILDFIKNIKYLESIHINLSDILEKDKKVFYCNHSLLVRNISILKDYQLLENELNHKLLSVIGINHLDEIIDTFIEISENTYPYLRKNPWILKELESDKNLMISIYNSERSKDQLGAFLKTNQDLILRNNLEESEFIPYTNTIVNKDSYDSIIEDYKDREEEYKYQPIEKLIPFIDENNPFLYHFDGILISRLKVERIYEILVESNYVLQDSLMYAITYHSLLNEEEYKKIEKVMERVL